jgi:hypothetical protein
MHDIPDGWLFASPEMAAAVKDTIGNVAQQRKVKHPEYAAQSGQQHALLQQAPTLGLHYLHSPAVVNGG